MRWAPLILALAPAVLPSTLPAADSGGEALFQRYCATCHGESARGDGPTAAIISVEPVDLTALAAANGGVFPFHRVVLRIDGRETLVAHGSPMPIYGAFFEGADRVSVDTDEGPLEASPPVLAIARYLESLQVR